MFRPKRSGATEAEGPVKEAAEEAGATDAETESPLPSPAPPERAAVGPSDGDGDGDAGPVYVDDHMPVSVWVESVLDTRPPPGRDELARQAEADFHAAIAPSLAGLQEAVPDATSPDEARRALQERVEQTEALPDPEGERLRGRDVFRSEASVHYRIQRHLERRRGRVGWGRPWEPPAGLAG
ncbi:MAG TPA: hypothetical protein VG455_01730 [Acidimicrobiales bacterium]|nr:hypothetical protein [Acidimicrobiales bacterium]